MIFLNSDGTLVSGESDEAATVIMTYSEFNALVEEVKKYREYHERAIEVANKLIEEAIL